MTAKETLAEIASEIGRCSKCRLCEGRINTVPGEGNPDTNLLFVGEAPGADEDESGIPFVGRAGDLLTEMLKAMSLERSSVFIANMVKCRPPNNRNPLMEELRTCYPYLAAQIRAIAPKVVVTMGNVPTKFILQTDWGITRVRGKSYLRQFPHGWVQVVPMFHPAYLARNNTKITRKRMLADIERAVQLQTQD